MWQRSEGFIKRGERAQLTQIEREREEQRPCCFPTPLSPPTHIFLSPLSRSRTHLRPHTVTGDLLIVLVHSREYHRSTKSEKWVTRGSCPVFLLFFFLEGGSYYFLSPKCGEASTVLCLTSQWIMVSLLLPFSLSPSLSPPLPRCVLDHWLTQYCLRLTAKGSRLCAKRLLTLAGAA